MNSGAMSKTSTSGLVYEMSIKPGVVQHLEDVERDESLRGKQRKKAKAKELSRLYLRLDISKQKEDGREFLTLASHDYSFDKRIEYFSFQFKKDIEVKINGESTEISDYYFEQNFNLGPRSSVFVMVENSKTINENDRVEVVVNNRVYENEPLYFSSELSGKHLFSKSLIVYKR